MEETANAQNQFSILAASARDDTSIRVLKQGETFAVFDKYGDLYDLGNRELGLYHEGTRYLSTFDMFFSRQRPLLLSSTIHKGHPILSVNLTNPDITVDGTILLRNGTLHLARTKFLYEGASYERLQISNYGLERVRTSLTIDVGSDFADLFEVRGTQRERRGHRLEAQLAATGVTLRYQGLDTMLRETEIVCDPPPSLATSQEIHFAVDLGPGESRAQFLTIVCRHDGDAAAAISYDQALELLCSSKPAPSVERCRIGSSSYLFNEWVGRSRADIDMMVTNTPHGPYPYAGIPWFSTPFGRDGIITALEMLWIDPSISRGVLSYLAATQATDVIPEQDAQPGKILHEARLGEMAALGEVPFGRYYGSVDATPLFVMLAGRFYKRTNDLAFIRHIWNHVELALKWIDEYGDIDEDGFVEYQRESTEGLVNQGWKDSFDSIFHANGQLAEPPIALCEVQGYVYAAYRQAADMAAALGLHARGNELTARAERLREQFDKMFWCDDMSGYALALDGRKQPCRVRTSNPGHCLLTGIVGERHSRRVAEGLFRDDMFSGWGIRTAGAHERRYNPMSYHDGSVWPHDNAIIAAGLARCGFTDLALKVFTSLFDSMMYVDMQRLPELFCGFSRRPGEGPTAYPVACKPQAWAAGAVFLLLEAVLGMRIDAQRGEVIFSRPALPRWLQRVRIENLSVSDEDSLDLLCERHPHDVGISVIRRRGNLTVVHHA